VAHWRFLHFEKRRRRLGLLAGTKSPRDQRLYIEVVVERTFCRTYRWARCRLLNDLIVERHLWEGIFGGKSYDDMLLYHASMKGTWFGRDFEALSCDLIRESGSFGAVPTSSCLGLIVCLGLDISSLGALYVKSRTMGRNNFIRTMVESSNQVA
jgi:hypothetical protein